MRCKVCQGKSDLHSAPWNELCTECALVLIKARFGDTYPNKISRFFHQPDVFRRAEAL